MSGYTTISDNLGTRTIKGTGNVDIATQQGGAGSFMDIDYACIGASPTIPSTADRDTLRTYITDNYGF